MTSTVNILLQRSKFLKEIWIIFILIFCFWTFTFKMFLRLHWRLSTILKTSKENVWSYVFWYVKLQIYSESSFNTQYIEIKPKCQKHFLQTKQKFKKCTLFYFASSNSWQFYFQFTTAIWAEAQDLSL